MIFKIKDRERGSRMHTVCYCHDGHFNLQTQTQYSYRLYKSNIKIIIELLDFVIWFEFFFFLVITTLNCLRESCTSIIIQRKQTKTFCFFFLNNFIMKNWYIKRKCITIPHPLIVICHQSNHIFYIGFASCNVSSPQRLSSVYITNNNI